MLNAVGGLWYGRKDVVCDEIFKINGQLHDFIQPITQS
jgi:hypothetical protein